MKANYKNWGTRAADVLLYHLSKNTPSKVAEALATECTYKATAPWHPESVCVSPNSLLRCGLFRVAQTRATRSHLHRHRFPLQGSRGGYVEYTGAELRQSDGDVFMMLLQVEQDTPGIAVVRLRKFAKQLGWGTSNVSVSKLEDCIVRMSATNLEVNSNAMVGASMMAGKVAFSLIHGYRQEEPGVWLVYLDSRLRGLKNNDYTRVQNDHLRQLPSGAVFASWLLKFLATHREPKPIRLEDLQTYCGSSSESKEFRRLTIAAASTLQKIGFLEEYLVERGELLVVRAAVASAGDSESAADTPDAGANLVQR